MYPLESVGPPHSLPIASHVTFRSAPHLLDSNLQVCCFSHTHSGRTLLMISVPFCPVLLSPSVPSELLLCALSTFHTFTPMPCGSSAAAHCPMPSSTACALLCSAVSPPCCLRGNSLLPLPPCYLPTAPAHGSSLVQVKLSPRIAPQCSCTPPPYAHSQGIGAVAL